MEASDSPGQPHDSLIRYTLGSIPNAVSLLQGYLPTAVSAWVDWEKLDLLSGSFVDEKLRRSETDLLYRAPFRAKGENEPEAEMLLYVLFEHQSANDQRLPLRLLRYMCRIWERHVDENPEEPGLPPILPLVLSHARGGWRAPTEFTAMLKCPEALRPLLEEYHPRFRHLLVDLARVKMDEVRGNVVVRLATSLLKAASEDEIGEWIVWASPLLEALRKADTPTGFLRALLLYAATAETELDFSTVLEKIEKTPVAEDAVETLMSIAETFRQKGLVEGERLGRVEGERLGRVEGERLGRVEGERLGRVEGERLGHGKGFSEGLRVGLVRQIQSLQRSLNRLSEDEAELRLLSVEQLTARLAELEKELQRRLA